MFVILTAITNKDELVIPAQVPKKRLQLLRENHTFHCQRCKEQVILKIGSIVIPHFAHKKSSDCMHSFSEGESEDHLNGKFQLYTFFQQNKIDCELESFLPQMKQRPDILVHNQGRLYAIEFQCSQISSLLMKERTRGYQKHQIIPIWILRRPPSREFPVHEIGKMHLSAFRQNFFTFHPTYGKMIIMYCPHTKQFSYITNPLHIRSNTYIVKVKRLDSTKQTWPFAVVKSISYNEFKDYLTIYKEERFQHLKNLYFFNRKGVQSSFLQICYRLQVHPNKLPFFIGIPTKFSEEFNVHSVEWQLSFIDYLHTLQITIAQATNTHCELFLEARTIGKSTSSKKTKAVQAYLELLKKCLQQVDSELKESNINLNKMYLLLYSDFLANRPEY